MLIFWIVVFAVSLFVLVKGADWLLASAEKIGLAVGLSPFIVGVTIVAFGTSFPELVSSFVAVMKGLPDVVVSNAVGSNIANILLIIGISAIIGKRLVVSKSLIDLDLPLLALSTSIFLLVAWDGQIVFFESLFLVVTYIIYIGFTVIYKEEEDDFKGYRPKIKPNDLLMLVIGIVGLAIGAKYLIDSIQNLSILLNIKTGLIAISAVAIGTSLPELIVSIKAALRRQSEVVLGNIFGSNVFNLLAVVGFPGIFASLPIEKMTFTLGLPVLILSTVLFIISGISRRIHVQEGALYILLYLIFITKLFGLF